MAQQNSNTKDIGITVGPAVNVPGLSVPSQVLATLSAGGVFHSSDTGGLWFFVPAGLSPTAKARWDYVPGSVIGALVGGGPFSLTSTSPDILDVQSGGASPAVTLALGSTMVGRRIIIRKGVASTGTVTIVALGSDTVSGFGNITLAAGATAHGVTLIPGFVNGGGGTDWEILTQF
jgi:hypothetical protein